MKKLWLKAKFLLATILGKADKFIEQHAETAIDYAEQLKRFVNSPIMISIVLFTKTKVDDIALATARKIIDRVVVELDIVKTCKDIPNEQERLKCFVNAVRDLSAPMQEAVYMKFASLFTKHSIGIKARSSTIDTAVQAKFFELVNKKINYAVCK